MIDPVGPAKRSSSVRRVGPRAGPRSVSRGDGAPERLALPAPSGTDAEPSVDDTAGAAAFAAQVMSGGPKRGLKGGPETLERARATYLETEWSGHADRRLASGKIAKADV